MIKIKLDSLINSVEALQKLSQTEMKAKLAWQVTRLLKAADAEIQQFNETRMNLIKKYGEKDENGEIVVDEKNNCKIAEDKVSDFTKELTDLAESEVEINANMIKIDDLDALEFKPAEMSALEPFIDFGEE